MEAEKSTQIYQIVEENQFMEQSYDLRPEN